MKIQNNITIFAGDTQNSAQADKAKENQASNGQQEKNKTIYAGNLLTQFPLRDRLQQRQAQAKERAMKIVSDTWDGDRKIDEQVNKSRERLKDLRGTYKEAKDGLKAAEEKSEEWTTYYGVEPDSKEQQDLELLKKEQASEYRWTGIILTEEEEEEIAEIKANGLTEYQKLQLEVNATAWIHRDTIRTSELEMEKETAVIRGIRLERLKKDPMLKAQSQAEQVMEAAREEAISMIVDEAKDHIDQEQEEKKEEAEAIEEKKEEQEEILEKRKDRQDELEELMQEMPLEEMADLKNAQSEVQQEIQNLVSKMNLVAEDIKGAKVDANL